MKDATIETGNVHGNNEVAGDNHGQTLIISLPGTQEDWKHSTLGPVAQWPPALRSYATTITALPYPAAVLWGKDYVLLHNQPWDDVGGISAQGQVQKKRLSKKTLKILEYAVGKKVPREGQSHDLLRKDANTAKEELSAVFSPLTGTEDASSTAILVQLLPKSMAYQEEGSQSDSGANRPTSSARGDLEIRRDEAKLPIDEHPFFRRFAEMLPSGLAILDRKAQAVFVNKHFYELTTMDDGDKEFATWPQSIHPDDYQRVMDAYKEAFESQKQLRTEFRATGELHPWRLLLLTPLGDENLQHVSLGESGGFICSIVDISSEKSAELAERKAAKEAKDRKEQQERFIDMISHEIRNPLSAVLHCAEDIEDAVRDSNGQHVDVNAIREAVETIHLCCTHQKNIVDDVLSFSKLDALSLVPKPSEPSRQLSNTLSMFKHEFRKQKLDFSFNIDQTYKHVDVTWVMADMARISQVLINLITNAIKFTHRSGGEKLVKCSVAASIERPKSYPPDVVFFSSDSLAHRLDATQNNAWGDGQTLYIMVAVKDTGIGISEKGQERLFERFRQATPKTEEVYGGSGLGLNISRKICQLHGGEIGVSSKEGQGSTFGFFFRVRRSSPPEDAEVEAAERKEGNEKLQSKIAGIGVKSPDQVSPERAFDSSPDIAPQSERPAPPPESQSTESRRRSSLPTSTGQKDAMGPKRPVRSQAYSTNSVKKVGPSDQSGRRCHVLLVEDNVINQRIVSRKLDAKGYKVTTVSNGQEAVDAVKTAPKPSSGDSGAFNVILMDQEMPVLDGNSATKAIRKLENSGDVEYVPILGVTANVRGAQQDEMLASGMDDVISKPYKIEEMVQKINEITGGDGDTVEKA